MHSLFLEKEKYNPNPFKNTILLLHPNSSAMSTLDSRDIETTKLWVQEFRSDQTLNHKAAVQCYLFANYLRKMCIFPLYASYDLMKGS